jgi:hypothetical protein
MFQVTFAILSIFVCKISFCSLLIALGLVGVS